MSPRLVIGDITTARVDAIVNAANERMLGGGGVDGAIHRAAGPALLAACREVPEVNGVRCPTGEARITGAGELQARHVIHTVGPVYAASPDPEGQLRAAYHSSFALALDHGCRSVACPAISCGVFGYPLAEASQVALAASLEPVFKELEISFFLFDETVFATWQETLEHLTGPA